MLYSLTEAGRQEAGLWWATPVDRTAPAREELAIKLALAITSPGVDVRKVLQTGTGQPDLRGRGGKSAGSSTLSSG